MCRRRSCFRIKRIPKDSWQVVSLLMGSQTDCRYRNALPERISCSVIATYNALEIFNCLYQSFA